MPIYEYRCTACGAAYDIYHRGREIAEDVLCPACGSASHKKLMSAAAVATKEHAGGQAPSCESGGGGCCGGGMCGME